MVRHQCTASVLIAIAILATAGCQRTQGGGPASAGGGAAGHVPAPAGSSMGDEHVATARYKIDIVYPALGADEAPLSAMLHRIANAAKRDFLRALPDPETYPEFADRQLQLRIDFKLAARARDLLSVRETGFQDTGGAHPAPIDAAIVYDTHARRTVPLEDLFANPDAARKAIADFARAELMKAMLARAPKPDEGTPQAIAEWQTSAKRMIEEGTTPTPQDFANFVARATGNPQDPSPGLTLIFPPYQVAAYVYGTQTVFVPTEVFEQFLKPQYRNAFGIPIAN